jgi:hypothetical protein
MKALNINESGVSLAELLVSSFLATLIISAAVAAVSTGNEISSSDIDRRHARTIARSTIERHYDTKLFSTIPDNYSAIESIIINPRGGNPITGDLIRRVTPGTVTLNNGKSFPVKTVTVVVKWDRAVGQADSIKLTKIMTVIL